MKLTARNAIVLAVAALVLVGAGVAIAQTQQSPSPSTDKERSRALGRDAFLDIVARRLGIERSTLDEALEAQALAEVKWAEDNGFIRGTEADALRERINEGKAKGLGIIGFKGGLSLGPEGLGWHGRFPKRGLHRGSESLTAAAEYLGLSASELREALSSKTLAQVARDQGKSVDGLKSALRAAKKAQLDEAVTDGRITSDQRDALLERFDSQIGDVVNGIPPFLTDLARRLGVDRARLITAIKNAAIEQIDQAVAQDLITKSRADALKQRIRSSPAWPIGGIRFGLGFGHGGPCGEMKHRGAGFDDLESAEVESLTAEFAIGL